jgi:hypothetical protein
MNELGILAVGLDNQHLVEFWSHFPLNLATGTRL